MSTYTPFRSLDTEFSHQGVANGAVAGAVAGAGRKRGGCTAGAGRGDLKFNRDGAGRPKIWTWVKRKIYDHPLNYG